MKRKMPLSGTLNIDSFYNNGAADAGVTYEVPSDQQSIIEVNASGVVTPKKLGTAIVNIKASGVVIGNVTISVVSAEEWALVEDPQALIANAEEVLSTSNTYTLIAPQQALSSAGYAGSYNGNAFDGKDATLWPDENYSTFWQSDDTYAGVTNAYIGQKFSSPKVVTKVRAQFCTAPSSIEFIYSNDGVNWSVIDTVSVGQFANASNDVFYWLEWNLPSYSGGKYFAIRPATAQPSPGTYFALLGRATIDRFRVWELEFYESTAA